MALYDLFGALEDLYKDFRHLSPAEIGVKWDNIERAGCQNHGDVRGKVIEIKELVDETKSDGEKLLRGLTDQILESHYETNMIFPMKSQDIQEVAFYCDHPQHKSKYRTIAQGFFPEETELEDIVVSPRDLTFVVFDSRRGGYARLDKVIKKGNVVCPYCKGGNIIKIKNSSGWFVYDEFKESEFKDKIKSALRKERMSKSKRTKVKEELKTILDINHRAITYLNLQSGVVPLSTLIGNRTNARYKQYPILEEAILNHGNPYLIAQHRMKFTNLITKYLHTQHIASDRDFIDFLGIRFIMATKNDCYGMLYGTLDNFDHVKLFKQSIEDYMQNPKDSGYQSLQAHLSISPKLPLEEEDQPEGSIERFLLRKCLEVQLRTSDMHISSMLPPQTPDLYHEKRVDKKIKQRKALLKRLILFNRVIDKRKAVRI